MVVLHRYRSARLLVLALTGCLATAFLGACGGTSLGPPPGALARAAVGDSVRRVWEAINAAWPDTSHIASRLAPEFRLSGASGAVYDRARLLAYLARQASGGPPPPGAASTRRDIEVRVFGRQADVAVLTAEITDIDPAPTATDTVITRVSDVFARQDGQWRWVSSHESFVRPPRQLPARWRRPTSGSVPEAPGRAPPPAL